MRLVLVALSLALAGMLEGRVGAAWTYTVDAGNGDDEAWCFGNPNSTGGEPSCHVQTNYGGEIWAETEGSKCAARFACELFIRTCYAVQNWGEQDAICYSMTQPVGGPPPAPVYSRAVCKSDAGLWSYYCEP